MPRLRDRNRQVPNGLKYYLPQTKWSARPWASHSEITDSLLAHLTGNPHVAQNLGWPLDRNFIADRVDEYNALICQQMGWVDYITPDGGQAAQVPFTSAASQLNRLGNVVAGAEVLVEWIKSGAEAVPQDLANERAGTCTSCKFNDRGDFTRFFTVPVSEAIRVALRQRSDMKLSTTHDHEIQVCSICLCPLRLKVHVPIESIMKRLPVETREKLPTHCWIKKEGKF